MLGPLQNNGGLTPTLRPLPESSVIDAAGNCPTPNVDQRGLARPTDSDANGTAACEIGAAETGTEYAVSEVTEPEGDAGTTPFQFTVTRVGEALPESILATTSEVSATAGSDYTSITQNVDFALDQAVAVVSVSVLGDRTLEADETFQFSLRHPVNARGTAPPLASTTGTIVNDDSVLTIAGDVSLSEGNAGTTAFVFLGRALRLFHGRPQLRLDGDSVWHKPSRCV